METLRLIRHLTVAATLGAGMLHSGLARAEREAPQITDATRAIFPTQIQVSWVHSDFAQKDEQEAPMDDRPLGFLVMVSTAGQSLPEQRVGHDVYSTPVVGLTASTTYTVKVCALFADAETDAFCSEPLDVTTLAADAGELQPGTPFKVTDTKAGTTWLRFSWVGSYERFIIAYGAAGEAATERSAGLEGATQFTLDGLRPSTTYDIVLKACSLELLMRRCLREHKAQIATLGPALRALPSANPTMVRVGWQALPGIDRLSFSLDGRPVQDIQASVAGGLAENSLVVPLANHAYTVGMCWHEAGAQGCEEVQARPAPTPPSPPARLLVMMRGGGGVGTDVGKALAARQPVAEFDTEGVAGEAVVLEREYTAFGRGLSAQVSRVSWGEIARGPWKAGRNALAVPPDGPAVSLGSATPTGRVRACAVVDALGAAGRACGEPVHVP